MLKSENALYNNPRVTRSGICSEEVQLEEEREDGWEKASHRAGASSVLYVCVYACVGINVWVYKTMKGVESPFPDQGWNPHPLHWKADS